MQTHELHGDVQDCTCQIVDASRARNLNSPGNTTQFAPL
jgi:hypothetical protein